MMFREVTNATVFSQQEVLASLVVAGGCNSGASAARGAGGGGIEAESHSGRATVESLSLLVAIL